MLSQSLLITLIGMGGVFFFLILLICFMNILAVFGRDNQMKLKALAIVLAYHQSEKENGSKK